MAIKHGEVTRRLPGGWTLRWDSTEVDPAMRKATDKVVDEHVASLRELLGRPPEPARSAPRATRRRSAAA